MGLASLHLIIEVLFQILITLMPYWCRPLHKKSLSDGNIIRQSKSPTSSSNIGKSFACSNRSPGGSKMIFESTPEISTCDSGLTCSRCVYFLLFSLFCIIFLSEIVLGLHHIYLMHIESSKVSSLVGASVLDLEISSCALFLQKVKIVSFIVARYSFYSISR